MGQFVSRLNWYQADETKESGWRPRNSSCFQWLGESRILGNSGGSSFIVQLLLLKGIREISVVAQKTKLYPAPLKEKRESQRGRKKMGKKYVSRRKPSLRAMARENMTLPSPTCVASSILIYQSLTSTIAATPSLLQDPHRDAPIQPNDSLFFEFFHICYSVDIGRPQSFHSNLHFN